MKRFDIFFQEFPGTHGGAARRGIGSAPYTISADGNQVASGNTASNGRVRVVVPANAFATIRIFDTDYDIWDIIPAVALQAVNTTNQAGGANVANLSGVKQRLEELGYEPGSAGNNTLDAGTDEAILNFQADCGLDPDGDVGPRTLSTLRNRTRT